MGQNLHIITDTSGSMLEQSKNQVVQYLFSTIQRFLQKQYKDANILLYYWNESINMCSSFKDFAWGGYLESLPLKNFINQNCNEKILIISDGDYSEDLKEVFKKKSNIYLLLIGQDDVTYFKKIFTNGRLFLPENIMSDLLFLFTTGEEETSELGKQL